MKFYGKVAKFYDLIFSQDYLGQVRFFNKVLNGLGVREGLILDVGCATGGHLAGFLALGYEGEGLDSSSEMLAVAQKRLPGVIFHEGRMQDLDLVNRYDVITLFSRTLFFVKDFKELFKVILRFYEHLRPGGVLIMDLDFHKDFFDADKSVSRHFSKGRTQCSFSEDYDLRGDRALWCFTLSFNVNGKFSRFVDDADFLLIDVNELIRVMRSVGFRVSTYSLKGVPVKRFNQGLIIAGVKK